MQILNQARKTKNSLNIKIYGSIGSHSWWDESVVSAEMFIKS